MNASFSASLIDATAMCEFNFAAYSNWFTNYGTYQKMLELQNEGFPLPENWQMSTLTTDPTKYKTPLAAFLHLNDKICRYMSKVKKQLMEWGYFEKESHIVYFQKLEFQANGYPHWHVCFNYTKLIPWQRRRVLESFWKHGISQVERLEENPYYGLKYLCKHPNADAKRQAFQDTLEDVYPKWFADYRGTKKVNVRNPLTGEITEELKPVTFDRTRFFQRSQNFMKNYAAWVKSQGLPRHHFKRVSASDSTEALSSFTPMTMRSRVETHLSRVQLTARDENGKYIRSTTAFLTGSFSDLLTSIAPNLCNGDVVSVVPHRYLLDASSARFLTSASIHKHKNICLKNKLTKTKAKQIACSKIQSSESNFLVSSYQSEKSNRGKTETQKKSLAERSNSDSRTVRKYILTPARSQTLKTCLSLT